ncbi:MAG: TrkA family potassium uptake protein [Bacillota bacterium]|nr:TrkA family potassium uptake protein [Bacillota bacterium]
MKTVLVIGMGRFGQHIASKFASLGNDVMVIDRSEDKIEEILPKVASAQIGDCRKESVLRSIGVNNFDICVMAIGSDFQSSLEITLLLKELGAPHVIARASRDIHAKFLLRSGADEVIYPEKQMAEKLAVRYSAKNVFDYIELTPEYSVFEITPVESWIGKTIEQIGVRTKYQISILATKEGENIIPLPKADHMFKKSEHLIVFGKKEDAINFTKHI